MGSQPNQGNDTSQRFRIAGRNRQHAAKESAAQERRAGLITQLHKQAIAARDDISARFRARSERGSSSIKEKAPLLSGASCG